MGKIPDHQPCLARAKPVQIFQHGLAIVDGANGINNNDDIERTRQVVDKGGIFDIAKEECKMRVCFARLREHALAEIHADAERGLECRKQFAGATSELKHPQTFADQKLEVEPI